METVDDTLARIIQAIDKYGKSTDVSGIVRLLDRYSKTPSANGQAFLLRSMLLKIEAMQRRFPIVCPVQVPVQESMTDGVAAGRVVPGGAEFKLSKTDLNRNILVVASVGHGKTSLVYNILSKLGNEDLTYMLFDLKRDYRALAYSDNTFYFNERNLRINPLEPPPGVSKREWAVHFADAFSHSFALLIGSRDFLLEKVLELYENCAGPETPSIMDLLLLLETTKARNEYLKVVRGRIKALVSSTDAFSGRTGISLQELDKSNIIFGIDNFGFAEQGFIVSITLSYLFYMNLSQAEKRGKVYKIICIDDAHTILDVRKEKDYALGIPLLHQVISKMRELGVGFIFSDQQASSLLSSVIQNSNIKFIGRINLAEDVLRIFGNRVTQEIELAIQNLKVGEFLVLSPSVSPYYVIKADEISIEKDVDAGLISFRSEKLKKAFLRKAKTPAPGSVVALKKKIIYTLSEKGFDFEDDGFGLLVKLVAERKNIYIIFMATIEDLSRLLDTKFDSLIDVVEEGTDKEEVIKRLGSTGTLRPFFNLDALRVCYPNDFSLDMSVTS